MNRLSPLHMIMTAVLACSSGPIGALQTTSTASTAPSPAPDTPPVVGDLPGASAASIAEFRAQADALYRFKERAFSREDADAIVDRFYAKNAIAFGPDGKPWMGREAFRKDYREVVKLATVRIEPVATHVGSDAAWEWVNFHATPKDNSQKPFTFIMLFVWARQAGHWYCGGDAYSLGEFPMPATKENAR